MTASALLVIDMQRGAFDGVRGPPIDGADLLVSRVRALVDAARAAGRPVLFVQHDDAPGELFEPGTPGWALHEALVPRSREPVIRKRVPDSFEGTPLGARLAELEVREVVLCGLQSEFCIASTAKAALALGHAVVVASDGHATWPSADKPAAAISDEINRSLQEHGARLQTTASLLDSLARDAWQREVAVDCNNRAWALSVQPRTPEQDLEMLTAAHASAFHWARIGTELNRMRATMLLAEVHALLGHGRSALGLATEMRRYFLERADTPDWELAFTHAIHAHCAHAAGDAEAHRAAHAEARRALDAIAEAEDRRIVAQTFDQVPAP